MKKGVALKQKLYEQWKKELEMNSGDLQKMMTRINNSLPSHLTRNLKNRRLQEVGSEYKMMRYTNRVICGDAYEKLKKLPDESINLCYLDPPFFAKRIFEVETKEGNFNSFDDTWDNDIRNYLGYMIKVLVECNRVLKKTGSLYLHCDWHASHYLKVELDKIFGYKNFRNKIKLYSCIYYHKVYLKFFF